MTVQATVSPAVPRRPLKSYKLLSFDIYGTLVDEEVGILRHIDFLQPLLSSSHPYRNDKKELLKAWVQVEQELKRDHPKLPYDELLARSLRTFARRDLDLHESKLSKDDLEARATTFGTSFANSPAFPDTVPALRQLSAMGFKLVPLSNISNASFAQTNSGSLQGFPFDAVFTGEDIGSYKPDLRNFQYLIQQCQERFGVSKDAILHVAHGLWADHEPAKQMGLQSVWIERPGSASGTQADAAQGYEGGKWAYGWTAPTLDDLAEAIQESREQ